MELHRLGVTAADLKPDNVLIDDELGDAVIADFGISSVVTCSIAAGSAVAQQQRGARRGGGGATRSSGVLRGTPNYMWVAAAVLVNQPSRIRARMPLAMTSAPAVKYLAALCLTRCAARQTAHIALHSCRHPLAS